MHSELRTGAALVGRRPADGGPPTWRVLLACAAVAMLAGVVTQLASRGNGFHPSLLLNIATGDPIAEYASGLDPQLRLVAPADHYDGVYYYAMARDPFASGEAHELIDLAAYRYGHPLYAWLAGALSGGSAMALPWVFWALSLASMGAAAGLVSLLARRLGASPWWGLLVAVSPGLLFSASTVLTEPFQVALVAALLLAWRGARGSRLVTVAGLGIAMCLTKEHLVLVPLALGLSLVGPMWRARRLDWPRLAALAAGPVALAAWLAFIRGRFSDQQLHYDDGNLGWPGVGWLETLDFAVQLRGGDFHASQIGSTAVPGLVATAVVLIAGAVVGVLRRDALGWVVVAQAGLVACLGWRTLLYPHEMFRIPALALLFAVLLLAVASTRGGEEPRPVACAGGDDLPACGRGPARAGHAVSAAPAASRRVRGGAGVPLP